MNKIIKFAALISVCLMRFAGCVLEELRTDQFSDDAVTFAAFAPNPVARGGALRITGSNLQKVTEVVIPGIDPITEIEVVAEGRHSEIRVIVPVDGPEVGPVSVVAEGKTYTSITDLTYSEPIIFESFSPANAMPGDVVTVKGDYMNNIKAVQFEGGVTVTEFESQSRYELKVAVPANAITGKIILCDVDENNNPDGLVANLFYSETELAIGDPTVKSADRGALKSGAEVKVTGSYLNMIESANFGGVGVDFTINDEATELTLALPAAAVDGDLALVSFAGKEFKAGAYTTIVPTELAIAAETRYKAGLNATITGKDLDLVTGAALAGTALDFTLNGGKITFAIPAAAADGAVTLTLANGKTVDTEAVELVKPTISEVTPLEIYAEEKITVKGEDLDLVAGVKLGGKDEAFALVDGALEITTSVTSVSGKVTVSLANGVVVESADEVKVNYHSLVIVTEQPAAQHIGEEVVLKGANFDLVENIFIGEEKVTKYSLRTAEEVRFLMPWNKVGMYSIRFDLFSGDSETVATQIEVQLEREFSTVFEGEAVVNWNNAVTIPFADVKKGMTVIVDYAATAGDYHMLRIINSDWSFNPDGNELYNKNFSEDGVWSFVVTDELYNNLAGLDMSFSGANCSITKVTVITEISQEKTIWEGSTTVTWDGGALTSLSWGGYDWSTVSVGQTITAYFTVDAADACLRFGNGSWVSMPSVLAAYPDAQDGNVPVSGMTSLSFTISDADLDQLINGGGLVVCGTGYTLTKLAVL